jgi:hypothetical protein
MNSVAIWPLATPVDSSGKMTDELQSAYSRGLCRAFADGLLRTNVCEVAVCLPIVTLGELTSWAVLGRAWNADEAWELPLPEDIGFFTWGTMIIAERVELHVLLLSRSQRRLLVDRAFSFPRVRIPACFSEVVTVLAGAIAGRPLTDEENRRLQLWGTDNSEAYLAYLDAWSAAATFRFGVSNPNPEAVLECAHKITRIDPSFVEAQKLQEKLRPVVAAGGRGSYADRMAGYSELFFPIRGPGQAVVS